MKRAILVALTFVVSSGCGASQANPNGIFLEDDPVFIPYADAATERLVSADWLEGAAPKDDDIDTYAEDGGEAAAITLNHAQTNGVIFLRAVLPDEEHEAKELRVLGENVVGNVAAFGFYRASVGSGYAVVESREYVAEMIERRDLTISGMEAHAVVMDIATVAQMSMDESARSSRAVIVIIRLQDRREDPENRAVREVPVMLIAGYLNAPHDFDAHLGDFEAFLASLQIGEDRVPER